MPEYRSKNTFEAMQFTKANAESGKLYDFTNGDLQWGYLNLGDAALGTLIGLHGTLDLHNGYARRIAEGDYIILQDKDISINKCKYMVMDRENFESNLEETVTREEYDKLKDECELLKQELGELQEVLDNDPFSSMTGM